MTSYATEDASVQLPTIVGGMHAPAGFHEPAMAPPQGAFGIVQSAVALLVPVTTQRRHCKGRPYLLAAKM